jgi:flavin-binding protein dodecin
LPSAFGHPLRQQQVRLVSIEGPAASRYTARQRSEVISIARIVEISSTSDKSVENAVEQGIARASQTLHGIRSAWIKEQEVQVEGDKIVARIS